MILEKACFLKLLNTGKMINFQLAGVTGIIVKPHRFVLHGMLDRVICLISAAVFSLTESVCHIFF